MVRRHGRFWDRQTLLIMPLLLVALTGMVMSSCSGSGGDSDGALCDQCGDDPDGPCQPSVEVEIGPGAPPPCDTPDAQAPCTVQLICRRKVDSAQRRCFPKDPNANDVNYQFRCDGSRPGGTPGPAQPTLTPTPSATSAPATCGNNMQEGDEVCDGTDLDGETCESRGCVPISGDLACQIDCGAFNFALCNGSGCQQPE